MCKYIYAYMWFLDLNANPVTMQLLHSSRLEPYVHSKQHSRLLPDVYQCTGSGISAPARQAQFTPLRCTMRLPMSTMSSQLLSPWVPG